VLVRVVVAVRVDGVLNAVGYLVGGVGDSLTKRVVLAFVVVISHVTLGLLGGCDSGTSRFFYSDLSWVAAVNTVYLPVVGVGIAFGGVGFLRKASTGDDGTGTFAKLTFGNVELRWSVVGGRAVDCVEVSVVSPVLNLYLRKRRGRRLGLIAVVGSFKLYAISTLGVLRVLSVLDVRVLRVKLSVLLLRLLVRLLLRLLLELLGLPVTSFLVDVDLLTVLRRLLGVEVLVRVLGRLALLLLLLLRLLKLLLLRLGTTEALFFVDANLFLDVSVVVVLRGMLRWVLRWVLRTVLRSWCWWRRGRRRVMDGSGEGFVDFFVTFPSV